MGIRCASGSLALAFLAALGGHVSENRVPVSELLGVARSLPSPSPAPFGPPNNGIHVAYGAPFSSEVSKGKQKSAAQRRALRYG